MLVQQLYGKQERGQSERQDVAKDTMASGGFRNLTSMRGEKRDKNKINQSSMRLSSSVGEPSSSEAELKHLIGSGHSLQMEDMKYVPGKMLSFTRS
jgi:hypothetical protein